MKYTGFLLFILSSILANAQKTDEKFYFFQENGPMVMLDNKLYSNAFTGGFYEPRFCNFDVNLDGIDDIIVIDFANNHHSVYVGNGDKTNPQFIYAPYLEDNLPKMYNWVYALDFNNDGKKDLFTFNNNSGIMLYENVSTKTELDFRLYSSELRYFDAELKFTLNVYVQRTNMPSIVDVDGDGDLDVFSFSGT